MRGSRRTPSCSDILRITNHAMGGRVVYLDGGVEALHFRGSDQPDVHLGLVEVAVHHLGFAHLVDGLEKKRRTRRCGRSSTRGGWWGEEEGV